MSVPGTVRPAGPADRAAIREINRQAFGTAVPGTFEKLLATLDDAVALVAELDGQLLGHVVFTPARIEAPGRTLHGMGLGELAVLPAHQRQGIGRRLAETGLARLAAAGCPFCIVVGHATYYPRLGFERGALHGLHCQWPRVPEESFMVRVLDAAALRGVTGVARFRDA